MTDADDDGDGRSDEERPKDKQNDGAPGINRNEDDGEGSADEGPGGFDDDEEGLEEPEFVEGDHRANDPGGGAEESPNPAEGVGDQRGDFGAFHEQVLEVVGQVIKQCDCQQGVRIPDDVIAVGERRVL